MAKEAPGLQQKSGCGIRMYYGIAAVFFGGKQMPTGHLHLDWFESLSLQQKNHQPQKWLVIFAADVNLMYIIRSSNTRYLCLSSAQEYALRNGLFPEILFQDNPRNSHRKKWNPPAARRIQ